MSDFGLSATIGTWGNVLTDYYGTKYDKQENELAYGRNVAMMQYQNWYNSPAQQMQRLKDAGLNPHLMYGKGEMGQMQGELPKYNPTVAAKSRKMMTPIDLTAIAEARKSSAEADKASAEAEVIRDYNSHFKTAKLSEWNQARMVTEEMMVRYNVMWENYDKFKEMTWQMINNDWTIKNFEAWLANQNMSKNDSLAARKIFEYLDKSGMQKKLEDIFLNRFNNQWK